MGVPKMFAHTEIAIQLEALTSMLVLLSINGTKGATIVHRSSRFHRLMMGSYLKSVRTMNQKKSAKYSHGHTAILPPM